jgi:hypothetical protein
MRPLQGLGAAAISASSASLYAVAMSLWYRQSQTSTVNAARYPAAVKQPSRRDLTDAEVAAREAKLTAAGLRVVTGPPGTAVITLLKRTGEIVPPPGLRARGQA